MKKTNELSQKNTMSPDDITSFINGLNIDDKIVVIRNSIKGNNYVDYIVGTVSKITTSYIMLALAHDRIVRITKSTIRLIAYYPN